MEAPMLKTFYLDLNHLMESGGNKNETVLEINDMVCNKNTFYKEYGGLCGNDDGILEEESLEMLFELSGITYTHNYQGYVYLNQNSKRYRVKINIDNSDEYPDFYFNFNTIESTREVHCMCSPTLVIDLPTLEDQINLLSSLSNLDSDNINLIDGVLNILGEIKDSCEEI